METVVGIFGSRADAERAVERLRMVQVDAERINLLAPGASDREIDAVPTTETEQPGMGTAIGGVVGGAVGLSGGALVGPAVSLALPGIGPIVAIGFASIALLGAAGAVGGALAGGALEHHLAAGLPKDEMFLYEDALRRGHSVVVALAEDDEQADTARRALVAAGAEELDAARERWWIGLRDAEEAEYDVEDGDFSSDEPLYRRGFEAALQPSHRGRPLDEVEAELARSEEYGDATREPAFRRGYERGQAYYATLANGAPRGV